MLTRRKPPRDAVTIFLDGEPIAAERGEPLVHALLAADKLLLARSPKLHRPRGPSCLRGACDGCLARVDGAPNVMTCLVPARGGERIEVQNVLGTRRADLLRVTDWFFPKGFDHHHLMAGVPGLQQVMQTFARRIAGLGRLPDAEEAERAARRVELDALVIGGGLAGMATASRLGAAGLSVRLVDDGPAPGGALLGLPIERRARLVADHPLPEGALKQRSSAVGFYGDEVLVIAPEGASVVRARAVIFATGAHDGVLMADGNDLPGVFSARAAARLLAAGISVGRRVVLVGAGAFCDVVRELAGPSIAAHVDAADVAAITGRGRVRRVALRRGDAVSRLTADAVVVDLPGAPAFELADQAGAAVRYLPEHGYAVVTDERGRVGEGLWAVGECTGRPFDLELLAAEARAVADDVLSKLGRVRANGA